MSHPRTALPAVFTAILLVTVAVAQPPEDPGGAPPPTPTVEPESAAEPGTYVGMTSCANGACHGAPEPQAGREVLGNEYTTRVLDPHYRAYEILHGEQSASIASAVAPGKKATEVALCLDCHSVDVPAGKNRGLYLEDGVSCEGCHGPAGGWASRHFEEGWSHADSVAAGMNDLADPASRAQTCLRCHLGEGESTVDHRLIAAGHPRLVFELDNYAEDPRLRHWPPGQPGHGVEAWAVGQAVGFRQGLDLLASKAGGDGPWPEFAELSCRSCHHPLDGSWRDRPGYRYQGGLPPWSPARWAALRHLLTELADTDRQRLDGEVEALAREVASMTGRQGVAERARSLAANLGTVTAELEGARWSRERTRRVMKSLTADRDLLSTADLATAEQVALALQSLASRLATLEPGFTESPVPGALDRVFAELQDPAAYDPARFAAAVESVGSGLR